MKEKNNYIDSRSKFFNKAIYKTYMKRYAFIAVLYLFVTQVIINFLYISTNGKRYSIDIKGLAKNYKVVENISFYYVITITILSVIFALVLFSYLQNEKSLTMLQSMPVSRKSLYFTNYMVFITLMATVLFIDTILLSLHFAILSYPLGEITLFLLVKFVLKILLALAVFSFTVFIGMLVSNFVLQTALVMVFFGLPMILYSLVDNMFKYIILGYVSGQNYNSIDMKISPYYFLSEPFARGSYVDGNLFVGSFLNKGFSIFMIILMIIISFVIGYYAYKKRELERCHEFIVFDLAKQVIVTIMALILSLIFANLMLTINEIGSAVSEVSVYISAFLGALIGYVIMRLIADKNIKILRYLPKSLVFASFVTGIMVLVGSNVLGYEDYIPKVDEVEYAFLYPADRFSGRMSADLLDERMRELFYNLKNDDGIIKVDGNDIVLLEDAHRFLIDKQRKIVVDNFYNSYMGTYVLYRLKNGKSVKRHYMIKMDVEHALELRHTESNKRFLSEAYDAHINMLKNDMERKALAGAYISAYNTDQNLPALDDEKFDSFLAEYKKDYINELINKGYTEQALDLFKVTASSNYNFIVNSNFTNSIQWMRDNGYANVVDKSHIELPTSLSIYKEFEFDKILLMQIDDKDNVAKIYNILNTNKDNEVGTSEYKSSYYVKFTFRNGESIVKMYPIFDDGDVESVKGGRLLMEAVLSGVLDNIDQ